MGKCGRSTPFFTNGSCFLKGVCSYVKVCPAPCSSSQTLVKSWGMLVGSFGRPETHRSRTRSVNSTPFIVKYENMVISQPNIGWYAESHKHLPTCFSRYWTPLPSFFHFGQSLISQPHGLPSDLRASLPPGHRGAPRFTAVAVTPHVKGLRDRPGRGTADPTAKAVRLDFWGLGDGSVKAQGPTLGLEEQVGTSLRFFESIILLNSC